MSGKDTLNDIFPSDLWHKLIKRRDLKTKTFKNVNIANDEVCSIEEIANIALKCLGKEDLELVFSGNEKEDGNYRKDVSSDKLKKLLGGFEFTPLSEGIKKVYNIYKDRHES